ncbi:hypothetical protein [Neolewinella persica]|uniref:hypothetical protein n=1 Tax=Neolewinella persica TaxID=70998 RepID=UPI000476C073|nr:hypothetical protein [Neolewinella persica]
MKQPAKSPLFATVRKALALALRAEKEGLDTAEGFWKIPVNLRWEVSFCRICYLTSLRANGCPANQLPISSSLVPVSPDLLTALKNSFRSYGYAKNFSSTVRTKAPAQE